VAFSLQTLESMTAALRAVARPELNPDSAIDVQLSLLLAFTGAGSVSLWTLGNGGPAAVAHAGDSHRGPSDARDIAEAMLGDCKLGLLAQRRALGVRVDASHGEGATLIAEDIDPAEARPRELLTAAAPILAALLDRRSHGALAPDSEAPAGAPERLLARLRFDLHDGPQQDVYILAQDLRLFRDQLRGVIAGSPAESRVLGRLDDLEAQVAALDGGLRRLSTSAQSPFLLPGSLPDALAEVTDAFTVRTGVVPRTEVSGDLRQLSDSQRVAVLALITEALSNIRKHSDAETVGISVTSDRAGVTIEVRDDGAGFDPEATMAGAARDGHLGLVGMHDRMQMLGGRTRIASRPGGPTVISAFLPRWPAAD
jgi:signal transduction histidine kinase